MLIFDFLQYMFESFLLVLIFLQTIWIHCLNIYTLEAETTLQRFFYSFGNLHLIVLNLIIYMKSTLDEAREEWEKPEKNATHLVLAKNSDHQSLDSEFVEIRSQSISIKFWPKVPKKTFFFG